MYGQTGAGKTYTMLGDYSKEILKPTAAQLKNHMKKSLLSEAQRKQEMSMDTTSDLGSVKNSIRSQRRVSAYP